MTIMQLRYFLALCEYGKLRIASEHIHVSEPAISVTLKRLEDEIGTKLFVRDRKQMILTEDGEYLKERAGELVTAFDRLEADMRRRRAKHPTVFRLGIPSSLSDYVLPPLFSAFMEKDPSILFEFVPGSSHDMCRNVDGEFLELAVCDRQEAEAMRLEFVPLSRSEMLGCVCPKHPLADRAGVTAEQLRGEKLIFMNENAATTREVRRWFLAQGMEPDIFMYSNRAGVTFSMLRKYNAVAFFLAEVLHGNPTVQQEGLRSFTMEPSLGLTHGLIRKKGRKLSKEAQSFYDFCRSRKIE